MQKDSYFFKDLAETEINNDDLFIKLDAYANAIQKQVYAVYRALPTKNSYTYRNACVLLLPHSKILFINFDETKNDKFEDYKSDFIDDLGYLSEKYGYKEKLGRPRTWNDIITYTTKSDFEENLKNLSLSLYNELDLVKQRKIEILISLIIGSINDPNKVTLEVPDSLIKKIKNKIILYDGNQSSFIYQDINENKIIRIQGLAGTGKTELLVQKIREKYVTEKNSRIVYACYNNVLWEDMKKRIPALFDFMKVDEQIKLNERLWIMKSWGNSNNPNTGLCSYICDKYNLPFSSYHRYYELENFAHDILEKLKSKKDFTPCFDYIFIDEGQDFNQEFIDLCNYVTLKKVYIAGDIFQNIFDTEFENVDADYILNKCYRTDPKTLMFAHSVGMGLYEQPVIRWLTDNEWRLCGYGIEKKDCNYCLTRKPIRRFEDIDDSDNTIIIKSCEKKEILNAVILSIKEIRNENTDVQPNDIAIVFVETGYKEMCVISNTIKVAVYNEFEWETNIGYETKQRDDSNCLFISNTNNIKGLEFPFVVTIAINGITNGLNNRNAIYMSLTRSFIKSYFIINNELVNNEKFINIYSSAAKSIMENNSIIITEPSEKDKLVAKERLGAIRKKNNRETVYREIQKNYRLDDEQLGALQTLSKYQSYNKDLDDTAFYKVLESIVKNTLENN